VPSWTTKGREETAVSDRDDRLVRYRTYTAGRIIVKTKRAMLFRSLGLCDKFARVDVMPGPTSRAM